MSPDVLKRFMAKVEKQTAVTSPHVDTPCHLWTASTREGYGAIQIGSRRNGGRRTIGAHRLAYEHWVGSLPKLGGHHGACVMHRCDNRRCVNPNHLAVGTNAENLSEMARKGRSARGEQRANAKLTRDDVFTIRRRLAAGETQTSIASDFAVGQPYISKIARGEAWGWLKEAS